MTSTFTRWARRAAGVAVVAALLAAPAGCAPGNGAGVTADAVPATSSSGTPDADLVLVLDGSAVGATLADTAAAAAFAAQLPLSVELTDAWGQAKIGPLPRPVPVDGAERTLTPTPGGIYYWPDTAAIAIYYDDLGQSVPAPGLVHLGSVDTGLAAIADRGRQATILIDRAAEPRS
jgi:hypothetical protein